MDIDVDIVIPWVNPADDIWFADYKNACEKYKGDKDPSRIRDFGLFPYFFRCISENAPWVRKIHLLLYSKTQIPSWLNIDNDKLQIHFHDELLGKEYLPTFSCFHYFHNIWKMKDLAENFIWFNDDQFIVNPVAKSDFFADEMPIDTASESLQINSNPKHEEYLTRDKIFWNDGKQKLDFFQTIVLNSLRLSEKYTGKFRIYKNPHVTISCKKTEVKRFFTDIDEELKKVNLPSDKFRVNTNVDEAWVYRYMRLSLGLFKEQVRRDFVYTEPHNDNYKEIMNLMLKTKVLCINDCPWHGDNFDLIRDRLVKIFKVKFPDKCEFEK